MLGISEHQYMQSNMPYDVLRGSSSVSLVALPVELFQRTNKSMTKGPTVTTEALSN